MIKMKYMEERENEGGDDYPLNDAKSCDICK